MRKIVVSLVVILALTACATGKHMSVNPGASSIEALSKLGPPTRVNQSVGGVEVWEYDDHDLLIGFSTFQYYIKDGKVIKTGLK
jgi:hypothetical protein